MQNIFLGIDPGLHVTGYAIIKKENSKTFVLDINYLKMSSKKSVAERVAIFYNHFNTKIKEHNINHLVLETPFLGKNAQTFLKLGYLRGILYLLSQQHCMSISEFAPREIKLSVTGFGGASKDQVARVILRLFPNLSKFPQMAQNDVTDAMAVCICGIWKNNANYCD